MSLDRAGHRQAPESLDLAPFRVDAVDRTVAVLGAADPQPESWWGAGWRSLCVAQLQDHVDYVQAALDTGDHTVFARYVGWCRGVLAARGVPAGHLATSLSLLEGHLAAALRPADAARLHAVMSAAPEDEAPGDLSAGSPIARYVQAAVAGDHRSVNTIVEEAMGRGGYRATAIELVQPALYEVGHQWQRGRVTVAQEHLATAISQRALAKAYLSATFAPPSGRTALLACVEGNAHSLGLRMVADMLEMEGYEASFLGADVPTADVVKLVAERRPALLGLSVSLPTQLSVARSLIEELRAELGQDRPEVWVGGLGTLGASGLWRTTGADSWAPDAPRAVVQA